jgi:hypothetical protein
VIETFYFIAQSIIIFSLLSLAVSLLTTMFNIQISTWCSFCVECSVRISEQRATVVFYIIDGLVFISLVERVYGAVRTDSLYKAGYIYTFSVVKCLEIILNSTFCTHKLMEYISDPLAIG